MHVVEPGQLGGGVYSAEQPDYLGPQQSLRAALAVRVTRRRRGLRPTPWDSTSGRSSAGIDWVGYECQIGSDGRDRFLPTDYLPRRLMGEYLAWFYDDASRRRARQPGDRPPLRRRDRHHARDRRARDGARSTTALQISVDHVVLTSGHTFNEEPIADAERRSLPAALSR